MSARARLEASLGGPVEATARGRDAIVLALERSGVSPSRDHVCLLTTSGSACASPCVQWALGRWRWGRSAEPDTRAVVVIHEWGIPYPEIETVARACRDRGWVLIEDCAHALLTSLWSGAAGRRGDWAIYSLPKFTDLPAGGLLCRPDQTAPESDRRPHGLAAPGARTGSPSPSTEPPLCHPERSEGSPARVPPRPVFTVGRPRSAWEILRCAQDDTPTCQLGSKFDQGGSEPRNILDSDLPAAWDATIAGLLDRVDAEAAARRSAWARYEAVARDVGAFPALSLPGTAVPWKLPLRLRGVHRLVAALRSRGYDAEACAHLWAALIPCGTGRGPTVVELREMLQGKGRNGQPLPDLRRVEAFRADPYQLSRVRARGWSPGGESLARRGVTLP